MSANVGVRAISRFHLRLKRSLMGTESKLQFELSSASRRSSSERLSLLVWTMTLRGGPGLPLNPGTKRRASSLSLIGGALLGGLISKRSCLESTLRGGGGVFRRGFSRSHRSSGGLVIVHGAGSGVFRTFAELVTFLSSMVIAGGMRRSLACFFSVILRKYSSDCNGLSGIRIDCSFSGDFCNL